MFKAHRRKGRWHGGGGRRNGRGGSSSTVVRESLRFSKVWEGRLLNLTKSYYFLKPALIIAFSSIPIDYNLYRKFWTLQDYFRNPVQCYDKFSWMTFLKVMHKSIKSRIITIFRSRRWKAMTHCRCKLFVSPHSSQMRLWPCSRAIN